ncbi:hypothetical protein [Bacteroides sp.]|jgi:hypothetical protein
MLSIDEKKAIIDYRKQKAYDNLNEAKEVAKLGFWIRVMGVCFLGFLDYVNLVIMTICMMQQKMRFYLI